jgi:hypothetical protein
VLGPGCAVAEIETLERAGRAFSIAERTLIRSDALDSARRNANVAHIKVTSLGSRPSTSRRDR